MAHEPPISILFADDQIPWPQAAQNDATFERIAAVKDVTREQFDEDFAWFKELLRELQQENFELHTANTFAEAERMLSNDAFDVAVIDRSWTGDPDLPRDARQGAGRKLIQMAKRRRPQTHVICLSQDYRDQPHRMTRIRGRSVVWSACDEAESLGCGGG